MIYYNFWPGCDNYLTDDLKFITSESHQEKPVANKFNHINLRKGVYLTTSMLVYCDKNIPFCYVVVTQDANKSILVSKYL